MNIECKEDGIEIVEISFDEDEDLITRRYTENFKNLCLSINNTFCNKKVKNFNELDTLFISIMERYLKSFFRKTISVGIKED